MRQTTDRPEVEELSFMICPYCYIFNSARGQINIETIKNILVNISEGTILNILIKMTNEAYTLLLWVQGVQ